MPSHPAARKAIRFILLTTAGLGLIVYVLSRAALGEVAELLRNPNGGWIVVGVLAGLSALCANGLRLRSVLKSEVSARRAVAAAALTQLFVNLLPFRAGEAGFSLITQRDLATECETWVGGWVLLRWWDLVAVTSLLLASVVVCAWRAPTLLPVLLLSLVALGGVLTISAGFIVWVVPGGKGWGGSRLTWLPRVVTSRLQPLLEQVSQRRSDLVSWRLGVLAGCYWCGTVLQAYCFLLAFYPLDPVRYLVLFTVMIVVSMVPVHGFAGLGTVEFIHMQTLQALGIPGLVAVSTAVGCHALALLTTVLFGLAGWLALHAFAGAAAGSPPTTPGVLGHERGRLDHREGG